MVKIYTLFAIFILVTAGLLTAGFDGFQSREEAEAEFERMYGLPEEEPVENAPKQNEHNSIRKFMEFLLANSEEKVCIVYTSSAQKDAAEILKAFLLRKRSEQKNGKPTNGISMRKDNLVQFGDLLDNKFFVLGAPLTNSFLGRMAKMEQITISGSSAQFKLFDYPNCMAIACRKNDMFIELVRVFIRSFEDFEEDSYIYFYNN